MNELCRWMLLCLERLAGMGHLFLPNKASEKKEE